MASDARYGGMVLTIATLVVAGNVATAAALEPHRAAYRLSLEQAHRMSGLLDVRGGLVIEWRRACDGWLSRQRLGFVATTETGGDFSHDVRFSSWEALDGRQMRYTVRSYERDQLREEYRGEAELRQDGGGTASFTAPSAQTVDLPPGTLFPTEHMQRILAEASRGQKLVNHEVFDGWGFDALTHVTSVIGAQRTAGADERAGADTAGQGRGWPVSMAYYNVEAQADLPEFEAEFLLTEQGVLERLVLDYGDFRLNAALEDLEMLAPPTC
jgi:hypothetical protein